MTFRKFVDVVAEKVGLSKKDTREVLIGILEAALEVVKEEGSVVLVPGVKLEVVHKNARNGRNPQTGEPMVIPEKDTLKVKIGTAIKKQVV